MRYRLSSPLIRLIQFLHPALIRPTNSLTTALTFLQTKLNLTTLLEVQHSFLTTFFATALGVGPEQVPHSFELTIILNFRAGSIYILLKIYISTHSYISIKSIFFVDAPDFSWRLSRIVLNRSISFFFEFIPNDSGNTDARYVALRPSLKWIVIPCVPTFILFIELSTGLFKKFILYVSLDNSDFLIAESWV